jgi:AraC-like DNA-binding protein
MNRRTVTVDRGVLRINQRLNVARGRVAYLQDNARIPAPKQFAIFLPPFTLVQASLDRCDVVTAAVAFRPPSSRSLPSQPLLIPTDIDQVPTSIADVLRCIDGAEGTVAIGRARHPSPLALRAKAILDTEYGTTLAIANIARRLRVSSAVLSRTFKRTYGMPPVRYRHYLRVMAALMRQAEGGVPANVFQDVGFEDLSRFYKILRKVACAAPGAYRPTRSKNAKT